MIQRIKDFIEENWSAFSQRCEESDIDPEKVLRYLDQCEKSCPEYLFIDSNK